MTEVPSSEDALFDPELPELVAAALEAKGRGEPVDLETICRHRPELREAVAASLDTAVRMPTTQVRVAERDRFVGRTLAGRYQLEARLGAGAMGVVYRALDQDLQRPVAIKILRSMLLAGSEAEARFQREAETLAAVRHASVVTIHDRGRTEGDDPFLVMELLDGASLAELMECFSDGAEDPGRVEMAAMAARLESSALREDSYLRQVVRWVAEVAKGLEAAHAAGVLHRDVKPSNIFVRRDGRPVLLDFGIAVGPESRPLTREGAALGTPAYMAPEALDASARPRPTLDVYGLAATLYHLLTLRAPYEGNPSQILTSLAVQDPVRAETLRPGLARDLQAILDRGMARRPQDRYPSVGAFARDLTAFLEHRPVEARRLSPLARLWRRVRASKSLRGASVVALAGLVAMTTISWYSYVRDSRAATFREAWRQVGGNFTLGNPAYRRFEPAHEAEIREILDEAVEHADDPIPARVVRAAFHLDHGRPAEAFRDMAAVARHRDTPYARALARAYAGLPDDASDARALQLDELPEPEEALDRYLAAFHERRADRRADVRELLDHPGLREHAPSLELGLAYLVGGKDPRTVEVIAAIEDHYQGRTAATAHWLGTYHFVVRRDYEQAASVLEQGLALNSTAHGLHVYGGWSHLKLGRVEEAIDLFLEAQAIRPTSPGAFELHARALIEAGRFDGARQAIEGAPYGSGETAEGKRQRQLGELEAELALSHHRAGDEHGARAAARSAVERFERAAALGQETLIPRAEIARALADDEYGPIFVNLLRIAREQEVVSDRMLEILANWTPSAAADEEALEELRSLFEHLAR